jgi:hypothetical protein
MSLAQEIQRHIIVDFLYGLKQNLYSSWEKDIHATARRQWIFVPQNNIVLSSVQEGSHQPELLALRCDSTAGALHTGTPVSPKVHVYLMIKSSDSAWNLSQFVCTKAATYGTYARDTFSPILYFPDLAVERLRSKYPIPVITAAKIASYLLITSPEEAAF